MAQLSYVTMSEHLNLTAMPHMANLSIPLIRGKLGFAPSPCMKIHTSLFSGVKVKTCEHMRGKVSHDLARPRRMLHILDQDSPAFQSEIFPTHCQVDYTEIPQSHISEAARLRQLRHALLKEGTP